jgi:hypothetical protein
MAVPEAVETTLKFITTSCVASSEMDRRPLSPLANLLCVALRWIKYNRTVKASGTENKPGS